MSARLGTIAFALVLVGFGCSDGRTPEQPGGQPPAELSWTTYESPTLGVRVPYPEGWYVEEDPTSNSTDFYASQPPADSDAPSDLWMEALEVSSIDAAITAAFPAVYERTNVQRSGMVMARIVYPYDARLQPDTRMIAYLWMDNGQVRMMGGPEGSAALEGAIDRLEVTP